LTAHVDTFVRDNLPPRAQWPELIFSPGLQYPDRYNASDILENAVARGHGARNAVLFPSEVLTYEALLR